MSETTTPVESVESDFQSLSISLSTPEPLDPSFLAAASDVIDVAMQPVRAPKVTVAKEEATQRGISAVTPSAFALDDDHEFPTQQQQTERNPPPSLTDLQQAFRTAPQASPQPDVAIPGMLAAGDASAPHPGDPTSPYRRCPCLAVLPGRICPFCFGSHWTRPCSKCDGSGRVSLSVRKGAERSQPCGFCNTKGVLPATLGEIREAESAAVAYDRAHSGADPAVVSSISAPAPAEPLRRTVRLPGIGATETKRKPPKRIPGKKAKAGKSKMRGGKSATKASSAPASSAPASATLPTT